MLNTELSLEKLNAFSENTLISHLGIKIIEVKKNAIVGTMPVDARTHQPMGLLHGGASAALMESLGSLGSSLLIDRTKNSVVGLEINANHIRGARSGIVTGEAVIIHAGRKSHVWQIDVRDENKKIVSTGRLTVMVIDIK